MKVNWTAESQNLKVKGKIQFCRSFTQLGTRFSLQRNQRATSYSSPFSSVWFASASHSFPVSHFYNFVFQMGLLHLHVFRAAVIGNLSLHYAKCTVYWCHYQAPRSESHPTGCHRVQWQIWELWVKKTFRVGFSTLRKGDLLQDSATFCKQQPNYSDFRPMYESPNIVRHLFYIPG